MRGRFKAVDSRWGVTENKSYGQLVVHSHLLLAIKATFNARPVRNQHEVTRRYFYNLLGPENLHTGRYRCPWSHIS